MFVMLEWLILINEDHLILSSNIFVPLFNIIIMKKTACNTEAFLLKKKRIFMKKIISYMKNISLLLCILCLFLSYSLSLYSQNTSSKLVRAQNLMDNEKYIEADKIFDEIIAANPNKLDVLYNAAYCKLFVGQPHIAINYLKKIMMKNNNDAETHNLLGLAYERTGFNSDAIFEYSTAITQDKNLYEAYFNRGRIYLQLDSIELAKKDFNYAKRNKIINPELYYITGNLYVELRQYDSALKDLNKILTYKKDDPHYFSLLGDVYFITANEENSKLEKSIEYYTKSLRLDSENVAVLKNRAFVYDVLSQNEKAELDREKIIQIQKRDGINPTNVNYRQLKSADNSFEILIPELWNVYISKNDSMDVIFFFDTNFNYSQKDAFYIYDFGGMITYYPKYFEINEDNMDAILELRNEKIIKYAEERKSFYNNEKFMKSYNEILRKQFYTNQPLSKMLVKYNFVSNNTKFYGIECFVVTNSAKLIAIQLWTPDENHFYYEPLLDYIYESLEIEK